MRMYAMCCIGCGETLALWQAEDDLRKPDGLAVRCRDCTRREFPIAVASKRKPWWRRVLEVLS